MLTFILLRFASLAVVFALVWALTQVAGHAGRIFHSLRADGSAKAAGHSLNQGRA